MSSKPRAQSEFPALSSAEQAIMDALWRSHPTGVMDLLEIINAGREEPITRNTLQTQLARLEAKNWVSRDSAARSHKYSPAVPQTSGRRSVLGEIKHRLFGGSSLAMMRCLVEEGEISSSELKELQSLIKKSSKEKS